MWDPFKDVENIMKQLGVSGQRGFFSSTAKGSWMPLMDIVETDTGYRVVSDLAGVKREDMDVVMDNNHLCISGNRVAPEWFQKDHYTVMSERGYGRFERCLQLPTRVVDSSLRAALSNGVLEVSMDKESTKGDQGRGGNHVRIE
jgi:HSP20 family protein